MELIYKADRIRHETDLILNKYGIFIIYVPVYDVTKN